LFAGYSVGLLFNAVATSIFAIETCLLLPQYFSDADYMFFSTKLLKILSTNSIYIFLKNSRYK